MPASLHTANGPTCVRSQSVTAHRVRARSLARSLPREPARRTCILIRAVLRTGSLAVDHLATVRDRKVGACTGTHRGTQEFYYGLLSRVRRNLVPAGIPSRPSTGSGFFGGAPREARGKSKVHGSRGGPLIYLAAYAQRLWVRWFAVVAGFWQFGTADGGVGVLVINGRWVSAIKYWTSQCDRFLMTFWNC